MYNSMKINVILYIIITKILSMCSIPRALVGMSVILKECLVTVNALASSDINYDHRLTLGRLVHEINNCVCLQA